MRKCLQDQISDSHIEKKYNPKNTLKRMTSLETLDSYKSEIKSSWSF